MSFNLCKLHSSRLLLSQFLKTLDAVDAAETPKPPERCSVTDEQLEAWFKEHDMIEAEVAAFDMGDMSRFKQQAKGLFTRWDGLEGLHLTP